MGTFIVVSMVVVFVAWILFAAICYSYFLWNVRYTRADRARKQAARRAERQSRFAETDRDVEMAVVSRLSAGPSTSAEPQPPADPALPVESEMVEIPLSTEAAPQVKSADDFHRNKRS